MPSLSATRLAYLAAENYTDCYCVRIVRTDGTILRFTSYPRDLTISQKWNGSTQIGITPVTYQSNTGYQMTAVDQSATLAIDNIDIMGIYESSGISQADLLSGVYDGAEVYIFLTDYENPVEDEHPIKKAVYGISTAFDSTYKIEFRGLTQLLNQVVGRKITTLSSRALEAEGVPLTAPLWTDNTIKNLTKDAYDWRPTGFTADVVRPSVPNGFWYYLSTNGTTGFSEPTWPTTEGATVVDGTCVWTAFIAYAYDAIVSGVTNDGQFTASGLIGFPDDWFSSGQVAFNTGDNANQVVEVRDFDGTTGELFLFIDTPYPIQIGDTLTATVGYDRTIGQCRDKFANTLNFGGFPYLPGPRTAARVGIQS